MRISRKGGNSSASSATSSKAVKESLDEYDVSAKYYDIWTEDLTDDIAFYQQMAGTTGFPILECMCGTGRILVPLAEKGYEVTGVDRSTAMLDCLTAKLELLDDETQGRIDVIHDDVRTFKTKERFKLAIVPFNSFLHLLETEDQENALNNIRKHLTGDGLLTMSVFNPKLDRAESVVRHHGTKLTAQGEIISKFECQTFHQPSQRTTVHYFYDISRQDRQLRRVTTTFTLRYLFHRETVDLLKRCGFDVLEVYGDYDFSPFKKTSDLMIFVARKAK
ncbi:MAG: class I SAM-dependent methyltransferase [Methanomassiliicoccales archaeon]|nr:class I SAM-dependent methyltransferase [Methanomassiliicoccales archaeon]